MRSIENELRETIGLDVAAADPGLVRRAVQQRMRDLGLRRVEHYRRFLEHSSQEWIKLKT